MLQKRDWKSGKSEYKIDYITLGVHYYCQFSCIYCSLQQEKAKVRSRPEPYDSLAILRELQRRGLLSEYLRIYAAPGEITIHPKREGYYDFLEEAAHFVPFATNAGKYDERISKILQANKANYILTSLDCGTRETFLRVRGVDLFDTVVTNLKEYRKHSSQIYLKYIILKENCGERDIDEFVRICKELDVAKIIISADAAMTWDYTKKTMYQPDIVRTAVQIVKGAVKTVCHLNSRNI